MVTRFRQRGAALASFVLAGVVVCAAEPRQAPPLGERPGAAVQEKSGVYTVTAAFHAPAPTALVKTVLTDYEAIPRFLPNVRASRVVSRDADHVIVEQTIEARMMMFSRTIHLLLDVRESSPDVLTFRDASPPAARSFDRYDGAWKLTTAPSGGTDVVYTVIAKPSFSVPGFILSRLFKRDSDRLIAGITAEIAARAKLAEGAR